MDSLRVLAKATALATKQSNALTSIAKATAYLSSGGWHEDASAFRDWSQAACGRSLPYLVPTRSLSSGQEYRERATLYLRKVSYELEAEGRRDILRSFIMEVQNMMEREDARQEKEKEGELDESEKALEEMDDFIGKLDDGDEDALNLAAEVMEKYEDSTAEKLTEMEDGVQGDSTMQTQ